MANTLHSSVNGLLLMECMCLWTQPTSQGGSLVLQNRGLVLAGTILILRTQMLPNLHQYSLDRMSQLLLKLLSTASSHLALRLSLKKKQKKQKKLMHSHPLWRSSQCQSIPCTKRGGTGQEMMMKIMLPHSMCSTTTVIPWEHARLKWMSCEFHTLHRWLTDCHQQWHCYYLE